ncbi:MAG: L-tyrosine/L-tryptophan isonitrile synthase family protein [Alphaproteobacteria bacterium]|nr:L-tyrosine/L-tryptophan isonitrile synthase family protein [Alphaproteobacteria bacterium]MCB9797271.1 L-tyrosine/L-tryptophan isonitrile synthase family protein [Alphaproteobacteria bacterium]
MIIEEMVGSVSEPMAISERWPARRLERGEVLWHQGDEAEELAVLESGRLEVLVDGAKVNEIGPGELFGEASAFMSLAPRTATLRATQPSRARVCDKARIARMRRGDPERYDGLLEHALVSLARRVHASGERLTQLAEGVQERPEALRRPDEPLKSPAALRLERHAARLALRTLPPLAALTDAELDALAGCMRARTLEPGEAACEEGAACRSVFLLADGSLEVLRNIGTCRAVPVATIERESLLGLLGLLLGTPRNATLVAATPCLVLEMDLAAHEALGGAVGRAWRETLLQALREHITSVDRSLVQLGARRAERIRRQYQYADALSALGSSASWPIVEPEQLRLVREKADEILRALAPHRRLLPDAGPCAQAACAECFALHRVKVERAVATGKPLHFILPAFPAKSPNTEAKVLGRLPDMAEEQSLRYLQGLCDALREVWAPGARVTICSDGRVFSDLVLVSDADISAYARAIEDMLASLQLADIDTFNLEDLFEVSTFEAMRDHLAVHYGEPLERLRERAQHHPEHRSMINGIHRFLFEDTLAVRKDLSRSAIRRETKERAYEVVQRSNAFSRLIAECFPEALRLSIHPQGPHSAKIGVLLGEAESTWITPWHGVSMLTPEGWRLVKRARAEELGARLVHQGDRPSHFVLEA